jgi:hypothetical protein
LSKGDLLIERGAERLERLARQAAAKGGFAANLADELAEDAAFLRKLKPSLIAARARGQAATNTPPAHAPVAPSAPQITQPRAQPKTKTGRPKSGPNPFLVAGAALAVGIVLAKVIDWRGHAHPRD